MDVLSESSRCGGAGGNRLRGGLTNPPLANLYVSSRWGDPAFAQSMGPRY